MFESILDATDNSVSTFVFDAWNAFHAVANDWITTMMILFVVITGYLFLIGRLNMTLSELFPRFFKLFFIYVLVTNVGVLIELVFKLFTDVPAAIATTLLTTTGKTEVSINASVSTLFDRGMQSGLNLWQAGGVTNVGAWILALIVWVVTLLLIAYVTFLLMLAKLAVAVLLALAPFFIILYLFAGTRSIFEGWLRQTISFALIPLFTYGLLMLIVSILTHMSTVMLTASANQVASLTQIGPYAIVMLAGFLLSQQIMGWAAGVAGGFQLSTIGAAGRAVAGGAAVAATGGGAALGYLASRIRGRGLGDLSKLAGGASKQSGSAASGRQRSALERTMRHRADERTIRNRPKGPS